MFGAKGRGIASVSNLGGNWVELISTKGKLYGGTFLVSDGVGLMGFSSWVCGAFSQTDFRGFYSN